MLFSPFLFISFVLLVMSVHYIIPVRLRYLWLLFCRYAFCLMYGVRPLFILLCTTLISFFTGLILERTIDGKKNRLVQTCFRFWTHLLYRSAYICKDRIQFLCSCRYFLLHFTGDWVSFRHLSKKNTC